MLFRSVQTRQSRPTRELFNNHEEQESSTSQNNVVTDETEEQNPFLGLGQIDLGENS